MTPDGGYVFISYASTDDQQANYLAEYLAERLINVWIAPRDVRPGRDYSEQLQAAIEECAAFVVLVTSDANQSPFVRAETEIAFSINKPMFPVRIGDIKPGPGLAFFLKIKQWTNAFGAQREASLERLARELAAVTARVAPSAVQPAPTSSPVLASGAAQEPEPGKGMRAGDETIRTLIGPRAPYYLHSWRQMDATSSKLSWNWPAFLSGLLAPAVWLGYRKMWPLATLLFFVFFSSMVYATDNARNAFVKGLDWALNLCLAGLLGVYGNHLLRNHILRLAEQVEHSEPSNQDRVFKRGGVSVVALVVFTIASALIYFQNFRIYLAANPPFSAMSVSPQEGRVGYYFSAGLTGKKSNLPMGYLGDLPDSSCSVRWGNLRYEGTLPSGVELTQSGVTVFAGVPAQRGTWRGKLTFKVGCSAGHNQTRYERTIPVQITITP